MKALFIIFAILFVAAIVIMIAEKVNHKTYDIAEAIVGGPLIMVGFWLAYCILC